MTIHLAPDPFDWAKDIVLPIAGGTVGFLLSRWSMTAKDRRDIEQKNFENSNMLLKQLDETYVFYTAALTTYNATPQPDAVNFSDIAIKGDRYFAQLNLMAAAILSNKVDRQLRDNALLVRISDAGEKTLPAHYKTLKSIAKANNFTFAGEMRRSDYNAIFEVVEIYGKGRVY